MAEVVFMDSFDHWNNTATLAGKWGSMGLYSMITGRRGTGQGISIGASNSNFVAFYGENGSGSASFAYKPTGSGTTGFIFRYEYLTADLTLGQIYLNITTGGFLYASFDSSKGGSVNSAISSQALAVEVWYHIGFNWGHGDNTTTIEVMLNENSILTETLNTPTPSDNEETTVAWTASISRGGFDDFYLVHDGDSYGDLDIGILRPVSDVSTDFTPNGAAANYAAVDDTIMDSDTTYNSFDGTEGYDLFEMENIDTDNQIYGAQLVMVSKKATAGSAKMALLMEDTVNADSYETPTAFYPSYAAYSTYLEMHAVNPMTGVAWTPEELNGLRLGYKKLTF